MTDFENKQYQEPGFNTVVQLGHLTHLIGSCNSLLAVIYMKLPRYGLIQFTYQRIQQ
jgi:hypothetical protein